MQQSRPCPQRRVLSDALARSIQRVYAAREDYEAARRPGADAEAIGRLALALQEARDEELAAGRAYSAHLVAHDCAPPRAERASDSRSPAATIRVI
jgi:predicted S18 family serine protease